MSKAPTTDSILPDALLRMTANTGPIDAVSYLALGHVFSANMTGNIVLLAFASTGVPQVSLSVPSLLLGFLASAAAGSRIIASASAAVQLRAAISVFVLKIVF
jgi:uncharacterized membrane protein YoaK (UPF0700 family)